MEPRSARGARGFVVGGVALRAGATGNTSSPTLRDRTTDALERGAGEYLHEAVGPRRIEEWYGSRPMTWDDLQIIGRSPRHPNLVLATGHGMLGVTMSAVTAELVTDLICARPPALDPAPLGLQRFA